MDKLKKTNYLEDVAIKSAIGFGWGVLLGTILNVLVTLILGLAFLAIVIMALLDINLG